MMYVDPVARCSDAGKLRTELRDLGDEIELLKRTAAELDGHTKINFPRLVGRLEERRNAVGRWLREAETSYRMSA